MSLEAPRFRQGKERRQSGRGCPESTSPDVLHTEGDQWFLSDQRLRRWLDGEIDGLAGRSIEANQATPLFMIPCQDLKPSRTPRTLPLPDSGALHGHPESGFAITMFTPTSHSALPADQANGCNSPRRFTSGDGSTGSEPLWMKARQGGIA